MFILNKKEINSLVSQNVIPKIQKLGGAQPFVFTEQGVAMLSGVIKSKKAIEINIAIMRAFVLIRQYALSHKDLTEQLKELEDKFNKKFSDIAEALNYLLAKDTKGVIPKECKPIGYKS